MHQHFQEQHIEHGGIVLLPDTGPLSRLTLRAAMLLDLVGTQEYRSHLFRWGALQLRLTHGFRLTGYTDIEIRHALGHD